MEAVWPCELSALQWLAGESTPEEALQYYRRAARLQPNNVSYIKYPKTYIFPFFGIFFITCSHFSRQSLEFISSFIKDMWSKIKVRVPEYFANYVKQNLE